jgi:uncharacterized protein YcbK (DUF882 family)
MEIDRRIFACRCGCGFDTIDYELLEIYKQLLWQFKDELNIHCACRCVKHNKEVGGARNSQHLVAKAIDISIVGVSPHKLYNDINIVYGVDRLGLGLYDNFIHIDVREKPARWARTI